MAYTAHKDPEQLKERYDSEDELNQKVEQVANLIKKSKHMIVFTGAGVSTSCGIPDFRGPEGVWTLAATGGARTQPTTDKLKAIASPTHMALVKLQREGVLKHLVSQNCDGLHRKSGIPMDAISELHGNSNIEQCVKCGKEYLRDYDATATYQFSVFDHRTGRSCVICGGDLVDTIINFGENLPEDAIKNGFAHANKADLCLVLGSSLTVTPACQIPETVGRSKNGQLVIVNLQNTPYDKLALKVHAKCDEFMNLLMKKLSYEIPPYTVNRRVCLEVDAPKKVIVSAVDFDGTPVSLFPGVKVNGQALKTEPFSYDIGGQKTVDVSLFFFGHYNEPKLDLNHLPCTSTGKTYCDIAYNPLTGQWSVDADQSTKKWVPQNHRPVRPLKANIPQNPIVPKEQAGFSVNPKTNCPHVGGIAIGASELVKPAWQSNACHSCKDGSENWMCLMCGDVNCSRYVKGHQSDHNKSTGHSIAISFSDLSVWCYSCDDYITDPYISRGPLSELHQMKFGTPYKR